MCPTNLGVSPVRWLVSSFAILALCASFVRIANVLANASAKVLGQPARFLMPTLQKRIHEFVSMVLCLQIGQELQVLT